MASHLSDLTNGTKVKVIKNFVDFDGQEINEGTTWTYLSKDYFVYDGGYTFKFAEGVIRLAEIDVKNDYVLTHFSEFFTIVDQEV